MNHNSLIFRKIQKNSNNFKLSVLIPSYNYAGGIHRILDVIDECDTKNIEFIISDDSSNNFVEQTVKIHRANVRIQFQRNSPALGAIENWNHLVQQARGEFVMVLHHDECPIHPRFFDDLCIALAETNDALVLDCFIGMLSIGRMRRHCPLLLKKFVLRHCPTYLLRRNLLGGPSVMVVRRDRILPFDNRIPMMVDVEWYCRLLRQPTFQLNVSRALAVLSVHHHGSITTSFGDAVQEMFRRESALLRSEDPALKMLALMAPRNVAERLLAVIESLSWGTLRIITRMIGTLFSRPIPLHLLRTWY